MLWSDDDLKFRAAMDVVNLNQLDEANQVFLCIFNHKTSFSIIVNVFVVELFEFIKGFIRLFKPVGHNVAVVIEIVNKA
ncbi:Uncharacterised protein [Vibrio cholerae]|nr:Uncharacterised protein [Vibrio cholerae]CSD11152.1 Uncharacterised protein [Vibrio cholerae]